MDLVIRGRSLDQRGARPWDSGRTRVAPGRTGPKGRTGPEWCQAGEDQRAWRAEQREAAVGECTPEGARAAEQSSSAPLKQQFQSKPASDQSEGQGAKVSSSVTS